jgi:tetratricopeptide (TPR) repeat protein
LSLALILWHEGWQDAVAHAFRLQAAGTGLADLDRRVALLEGAVARAPFHAPLASELGQARMARFALQQAELGRGGQAVEAARWVLRGVPLVPLGPLTTLPSSAPGLDAWTSATAGARAENERAYRDEGLEAMLRARDLCPYLPWPQIYLAGNSGCLASAEPPADYRRRAKRAVPSAPDFWFRFGMMEYLSGQPHEAARSWRQALELSPAHLDEIVDLARLPPMGLRVLLDDVLPARGELLVHAAGRLYPRGEEAALRRPFFEKALVALGEEPLPRSADSLFLEARLLHVLGHTERAVVAFERALVHEPRRWQGRLEFAELLRDRGEFGKAREELITVLAVQPGHEPALEMLRTIDREIWKAAAP